jgi:hypothetical protein
MNFFSRLFGSKKTDSTIDQEPGQNDTEHVLFTNAPGNWPTVTSGFLKSNLAFAHKFDDNRSSHVWTSACL